MSRNESMTLPPGFKESKTKMDNHFSKMSLKEYVKSIGLDFSDQTNLRSFVQEGEAPDIDTTTTTSTTPENTPIFDTYCDIFGTDDPRCISCLKRCGQDYQEKDTCHCHSECQKHGNCCEDYKKVCQKTDDTCKGRCWQSFDPNDFCHCNSLCRVHGNCCLDINLCPIQACENLCIWQNCTSTAPEDEKIPVEPKLSNLRSKIEELLHIGQNSTQKSDPNCAAQCWEHCKQKYSNIK